MSPNPKFDSVTAAEASFFPCVWSSLTHTLLPSLTACIQVPLPRPSVELRVMWQVLAAACCLHPAKALLQLRVTTTLGAWEESERGAVCEKREKMWRSGQPIWKATCSLLGLNLLLGLCYWTCCRWLKGSGVRHYKTPDCVGSSERWAFPIRGEFHVDNREILRLFPSVMVQLYSWKVTKTKFRQITRTTTWN